MFKQPSENSSAWLLFSSACAALSQVAILALSTGILGAQQGQQFIVGLALSAPIFAFADMGLRIQGTAAGKTRLSIWYRLLRYRMTAYFVAIPLMCVVGLGLGHNIWVVLLIAVVKSVDGISDVLQGAWHAVGCARTGAIIFASNCGLTVCCSLIFVYRFDSLIPMLCGSAICSGLAATLSAHRLRPFIPRNERGPFPQEAPGEALLRNGILMGFALLLGTLASSCSQILLARYGSPIDSITYSALLYVVVASEMVMTAMSRGLLLTIADLDRDRAQRAVSASIRRWTMRLLALCAGGAPLLIITGRASSDISRSWMGLLTPTLAITLTAVLLMLPAIYMLSALAAATDRFVWSAISNGLGAIMTISIGPFLIGQHRVRGALLTLLLAYATKLLALFVGLRISSRPGSPQELVAESAV